MEHGIDHQPYQGRSQHDQWLGYSGLLGRPEEKSKGDHGEPSGGQIDDGLATEQNHCSRDCTDRRSCNPAHKRRDTWPLAKAPEDGCEYDGEHVRREKRAERSDAGSRNSRDKKADESRGNDHRTRCEQDYRDRVYELLPSQSVMLADHATIQEGNDGEATAKNDCPCLKKEQEERPQRSPSSSTCRK